MCKFIFTLFLLQLSTLHSQVTFQKIYGGTLDEYGFSVQQTSDEGFIVAGSTKSFGAGSNDFYIIRTNQSGDTLWTKTYGGSGYDYAIDVLKTNEDGFIIAGYTNSFGTSDGGIYLVKINEFGDTLWTKTIILSLKFVPEEMINTSDGGYIICGRTEQYAGDYKYCLVKLEENGDTVWTKSYECGIAKSIQQTSDDGYILVVYPNCPPIERTDIQLVKTDSQGDTTWTKFFGGSGIDLAFGVHKANDEGYVLAGRTSSFGAGGSDFFLLKTDSNGDSLWMKTYGGAVEERAFVIEKTSDGGFIVGGFTSTFGAGVFDFYLVRTDENGDSIWTRTYGGNAQDEVSDIKQTSDAGFVAVGYTYSFGAGSFSNIYLVKTDENGLVTIMSESINPEEISFDLYQNFPNPFNPSTTIKYQIPEISFVTLKVYDVLGNELETLVNEEKPAGTYELTWNAASIAGGLPSGIYFYQLKAGSYAETKKMLLLK